MSKIVESINLLENFEGEFSVWGVHELIDGVAYLIIVDSDKKSVVIQDTYQPPATPVNKE